jgi:hypothetical protein
VPAALAPVATAKVQVGSPGAKKAIIAAIAIVAVAAAAFFGYNYYLDHQDNADSPKAKSKTAEATPTPTNAPPPEITAEEINKKSDEALLALNTLSAKVHSVGTMDLSGLASAPGMESKMAAMMGNMTNDIEFTIKLGRTNYYCVEAKGHYMGQAVHVGAWNSGEGDFLLLPNKTYMKMPNRTLALGMLSSSTGLSAVSGMVTGFFQTDSSESKKMTKEANETINGEECYVLAANESGAKVRIWLSKTTFLPVQDEITLGGGDTEAQAQAQPADATPPRLGRPATGAGRTYGSVCYSQRIEGQHH